MKNFILQRIEKLRALMAAEHIDAYIVPTDDYHSSEYVGKHFKCREYITGFTGSAGTAIITKDTAGLWTDARYFIQAAQQLEGTGITLFRSGLPDVPSIHDFLKDTLAKSQTLGFDGRTIGTREVEKLKEMLSDKEITFKSDKDLIGNIWQDRPELSCEPAFELNICWCGQSRREKCDMVRQKMREKGADVFILSTLDEIAWLLNIRGNDVAYNPVVLAYLAITAENIYLFANTKAFIPHIKENLGKDGIVLKPYDAIYDYVASLKAGKKVLLCKDRVNFHLFNSIPKSVKVLDDENPTYLPKAIKNKTEIENERIAHIKDGIAVTKFIYWLKHNVGKISITELHAAEKLLSFRAKQDNFVEESFDPIVAYGEHAAIVHYSATAETDIPIQARGLLLVDSGGHYLEGTTDITRTIAVGKITPEERGLFTTVLRGHLNLSAVKFLKGSCGANLDYIARAPLWEIGKDFRHGTGHGVGYLLNVHEGPNSFRWNLSSGSFKCRPFEAGMITSNEPGYYEEGKFGIRHENLVVCVEAEMTEAGQFLCFENLTMVPFDLDAIEPSLMSSREKEILNAYHKEVYLTIAPHLTTAEALWLKKATRKIH